MRARMSFQAARVDDPSRFAFRRLGFGRPDGEELRS
jgi:hypothetical protein